MTWIFDIIAIFFILSFSIYGLVKGSYYMVIDTLLVVVCLALAGVGAYFTELGLAKLGLTAGFGEIWVNILGASKIPNVQPILNEVALGISKGLLILVPFIIYLVILHALRKLLLKGVETIRANVPFLKGLGNFLGFIINFALSTGIVLIVMAFFHAFKESDYLFRYVNEALQASEILSLIYDVNPLNSLIAPLGSYVEGLLSTVIN